MTIRSVKYYGEPVLRKKAKKVDNIDAHIMKILDDMAETMYSHKGVGLAAPQVGLNLRLIVIDAGEGLIKLINPKVIHSEGIQEGAEGCLSFPGIYGDVTRPKKVTIKAQNEKGVVFKMDGEDLLARAIFHEIDHLDGKLFVDIAANLREILPLDEEEAEFELEEEAEAEAKGMKYKEVPISHEELKGKFLG